MFSLAFQLPEGLTPNLELLLPEFIVAGTALGAILPELILPAGRRAAATAWTCFAGLVCAFIVVVAMGPSAELALAVKDGDLLVSGLRMDAFSVFCRALITGGGALLVLISMAFTNRLDRGHGEFYAILLFSLLGVMLVSGVSDLLSLFVCLELVTIMAYVLAAFRRNDLRSTEAGLKYLVVGAVSTALLLLGIGLIYGWTGSLSLDAISAKVWASAAEGAVPPGLLLLGTALLFCGLFFKVGGVPFHVWIPDVYQGAPSPVTAFLVTASKSAGVILLLRMAQALFVRPEIMDSTVHNPLAQQWVLILGVVACITLLFGVLGAMPQRGIKRMLAYSSIGHAGYLLMGLAAIAAEGGRGAASGQYGTEALLYYLMAYFVTSIVAFGVIIVVGAASNRVEGGAHGDRAYEGLWSRSPFLAVALCLALLSLAGVPPMSGFFAKFLILRATIDKGLYALAFIGAGAVVVSLYFYLLWIKSMYFKAPPPGAPSGADFKIPASTRVVLWAGMAAMVIMGVWMPPFYDWAHQAAASLTSLAGR
ncbi:MAG: NADH-quinone oxidoreductase subunit N [Planctomycetota bacterium]|nr:NADH-quinone oxidoreductase subunit N [Planctomycetota bacterium]